MMNAVDGVLSETIEALSRIDATRLEALAARTEALAMSEVQPIAGNASAGSRNLQHTLAELLRNSERNIRLLSELRLVRVAGSGEWSTAARETTWVR